MPNYLKLPQRQQVIALLELGWTYRRIEAETGVRRETVSRYDVVRRANAAKVFAGSEGVEEASEAASGTADPSNAAKTFAGSGSNAAKVFPGSRLPPRAAAAQFHDVIVEKVGMGLTAQRIWQDLVEEFGYGSSYESIKRYVRALPRPRRAAGVYHTAPGEEAQVDFFQGAPTLDAASGQWKRPWVFRMTLSCSRHGYEEAVWDQKVETFLRLHENAFRDLGGVPLVVRHDNLKAAVVRACLYDPDINAIYAAFAAHWGFTPLPSRPRNPEENGKQERSGGYVKDNALKGRRFDSLAEQNAFLRHWNRTIARVRIHGTTRRQVFTHYLETDKTALHPLAEEPFAFFECGTRSVHPDGHVEVEGAFYPVPLRLLGRSVQARWDRRLVRVFYDHVQLAVHARVAAGQYATRPGGTTMENNSQKAYTQELLARCARIGSDLRRWAEDAVSARGVRAIRLIQGVVRLTRAHPRERVLSAARTASEHQLFRYKDLHRLVQMRSAAPEQRRLIDVHPDIRPVNTYRLEDLP